MDLYGPLKASVLKTDAIPKQQHLHICTGVLVTQAIASDCRAGKASEGESESLDLRQAVFVKEVVDQEVLLGVAVIEIFTDAEIQGPCRPLVSRPFHLTKAPFVQRRRELNA